MNGSSALSAPIEPTSVPAEQPIELSRTITDTDLAAPTDIPSTSTVPPHIAPPTSDDREGPSPSVPATATLTNRSATQSEIADTEIHSQAMDVTNSANLDNAPETDSVQGTSYQNISTPPVVTSEATAVAKAPPLLGVISTTETAESPTSHDAEVGSLATQAHIPVSPPTLLQENASSNANVGNIEQGGSASKIHPREDDEDDSPASKRIKATEEPEITSLNANNEKVDDGSTGKVHPREDDLEDGSPASKRAKLEDSEQGPEEFKVPEVPQHANAVEENGVQGAVVPSDAPESSANTQLSTSQLDTEPMTNAQHKALADVMKNVRKLKDAKPFGQPVDPVGMGIPTYPDIIKNPMDLSTVDKKLKGSQYNSVADLASDFDLMIQNCLTFNGPHHAVSVSAVHLQEYFRRALQKVPSRDAPQPAPPEKKPKRPSIGARQASDAPRRPSRAPGGAARSPPAEKSNDVFALLPEGAPVIRRDSTLGDRPKREIHRPAKDLPYASAKPRRKKFQQELRFVDHIVAEMNKAKYSQLSWPFSTPVDPVALNIPTYFSVIKKPMDFGTITSKTKTNQYENAKEFKNDVELMFENCFKFNPASDNVHQIGKQYQDIFRKLWAEKDDWLAENAPTSGPQSPGLSPDSDEEDADDEEGEEEDDREAKLRAIQQQIAALSQEAADVLKGSVKKSSPKAPSRKNSSKATKSTAKGGRKSSSLSGPGTKAAPKPAKRVAKVKPLTQDEKTEIQEKVERLTDQQPDKAGDLVRIIKENDPKFAVRQSDRFVYEAEANCMQNLAEDEIELELEELEVDVARMLLKYVRKFYPQAQITAPIDDDDFEPERRAAKNAAATSSRKKNKPMTKVQQETDMSAIRNKLNQYGNPAAAGEQSSDPPQQESSDDDDSGSESEEE